MWVEDADSYANFEWTLGTFTCCLLTKNHTSQCRWQICASAFHLVKGLLYCAADFVLDTRKVIFSAFLKAEASNFHFKVRFSCSFTLETNKYLILTKFLKTNIGISAWLISEILVGGCVCVHAHMDALISEPLGCMFVGCRFFCSVYFLFVFWTNHSPYSVLAHQW